MNINPFIITLGTMSVVRGVGLYHHWRTAIAL